MGNILLTGHADVIQVSKTDYSFLFPFDANMLPYNQLAATTQSRGAGTATLRRGCISNPKSKWWDNELR